jgi:hypothetical protein
MVKGRSPRVVFRERLRIAKSLIESDIRILDSFSGRVYDPAANDAIGNFYMRARRDDEKIENQVAPWRNLAHDFDSLASYFAREAQNARTIADTIERGEDCPRFPSRPKKAS